MKKILVLTSLIILGSCSLLGGKPTTFDEHYARSIDAFFEHTEKTLEGLGMYRSSEVTGVLDMVGSIPTLMSGSFQTNLEIQSDNRDASIALKNGVLQYDGLTGSGRMSYDLLHLISKAGGLYVFYQGLSESLMPTPEVKTILTKYEKTWLSWTQADALSGATDPDELRATKIAQKIGELSLSDMKKYLKDYPIFRSTADLGMSGSVHMWSVELDREKLMALIEKVSLDLSGEAMTDTDKESMKQDLSSLNLVGKMGFSSDDALVTLTDLTATQSGTTLGSVMLATTKVSTEFSFREGQGGTELKGNFQQGEKESTGKLLLVQSGSEMGSLTVDVKYPDKKFQELSINATAEGVSVMLTHTVKDNAFEGRLLLPVGSISWKGAIKDDLLAALNIRGASPAGALDLDLTQSGEMIRGPLTVRVGDEEVLNAQIGLLSRNTHDKSKFRLIVDVPQGTGTTDMIHGELGWDLKLSSWKDSLKIPSPLTPLQKLIDELDALSPEVMDESGQLYEYPSSDVETGGTQMMNPTM